MGNCCRLEALAEEALESSKSFQWVSGEFGGKGSITDGAQNSGGLGMEVDGILAEFGEWKDSGKMNLVGVWVVTHIEDVQG